MSTVKEGAAHAGWPFTTVSRLIHQSGPVSARVRHLAEAAKKCLRPVSTALTRPRGQPVTRNIGMLVVDNTHPFFAELVRGIEEVCYRHQYTVILCNSYNDAERQETHLRSLLEKRVDGLIVAAVEDFGAVARQLGRAGVPVVFIDRHVPGIEADTVQVNHGQGGYRATRHLLGLEHRLIGCISGPSATSVFPLRVDGYRRALAGAGIAPRAEWVAESTDLTMEAGQATAERLLRQEPGLTAWFVTSDILGIGALRCAAERGIVVPRDLSIIGFDGVEIGQYLSPALTSIGQPTQCLGELAAASLLERIRYGSCRPYRDMALPPELIVRESTGPVPS